MTDAQVFQVLGIAYLACGLGALINSKFYRKVLKDYTKNLPVVYLNAFIIYMIGFWMVFLHNDLKPGWSILITIIGWMALLKGLFMLILPKNYLNISKHFKRRYKYFMIEAVLVTITGAFLSFLGFFILS